LYSKADITLGSKKNQNFGTRKGKYNKLVDETDKIFWKCKY